MQCSQVKLTVGDDLPAASTCWHLQQQHQLGLLAGPEGLCSAAVQPNTLQCSSKQPTMCGFHLYGPSRPGHRPVRVIVQAGTLQDSMEVLSISTARVHNSGSA
jgi:hypothetical protein